jgi:hypothetical protein
MEFLQHGASVSQQHSEDGTCRNSVRRRTGPVLFLPAMIFATDKHDVMVQQDALGK